VTLPLPLTDTTPETIATTAAAPEADWPAPPSELARAWGDIVAGLGKSWMWTAMALQDIKLRYRGSVIGPFWLTVSNAIMIGAIGTIYPTLFHADILTYFPYLMVSLVFWQFISTMITEGCQTFLSVQPIIQQVPLPFSVHAYRLVCRNLIVLAHSALVIPIGLLIFPTPIGAGIVWLLPALLAISLNGVWIAVLLGMLSARYRDVPPIVASFVQVLFFVTPIFWTLRSLGPEHAWLGYSPLAAAVDVLRAPLLGVAPEPASWPIVIGVTVLGCGAAFALFSRFRGRIAYWI
jgi:ABC-2 type transport system permease protein/lipopolysaccharide transport system permease protein